MFTSAGSILSAARLVTLLKSKLLRVRAFTVATCMCSYLRKFDNSVCPIIEAL